MQNVNFISQASIVVGCCLTFLTSNLHAKLPGRDGESPIPVIDVHTHIFNANDLPLEGLLGALGVPDSIAHSLAIVLNAWTPVDDLDAPLPPRSVYTTSAMSMRNKLGPGKLLRSVLTPKQRQELAKYAGVPEKSAIQSVSVSQQAGSDAEIVARALQKADFPPGEQRTEKQSVKMQSVEIQTAGFKGYLDFVDIMTNGNLRIAQRLHADEYPKVDLFVHHMMDMEKPYADEPRVSFDKQITRMAKLDRRFDGRFMHFVAFDPFRRDNSLASVIRGIDAGAAGVKFYPPSGYRATDNAIPSKPCIFHPSARKRWNSRYSHLTGVELDAINEKLFLYCEKHDIPIFTHCTPGGFEAEKGYGQMADPVYWEKVLIKHPSLRLCLAHSGGEDYWFSSSNNKGQTFGENVVKLCLKYPNVYCEVGYMEKILDPALAGLLDTRLRSVINRRSTDGAWAFGEKIMYGTDWHMIHKEQHHRDYLCKFHTLFAEPGLKNWQRPFFSGNAVRFLKLPKLAKDERFTVAQRDYWQSLVTRSQANSKPRHFE